MTKLIAAMASALLIAGCSMGESEQECYDRISADLMSYSEVAKGMGEYDLALAAMDSNMAALSILFDNDRNICDYVTAEPYLQRK